MKAMTDETNSKIVFTKQVILAALAYKGYVEFGIGYIRLVVTDTPGAKPEHWPMILLYIDQIELQAMVALPEPELFDLELTSFVKRYNPETEYLVKISHGLSLDSWFAHVTNPMLTPKEAYLRYKAEADAIASQFDWESRNTAPRISHTLPTHS